MRPLKDVSTKALYALHRGIEKQVGLSGRYFHLTDATLNFIEGETCKACALGSLGESHEEAVKVCIEYGLLPTGDDMYSEPTVIGRKVERINDWFNGSPEERREFMLRHIVEELRQRGLSVTARIRNSGSEAAEKKEVLSGRSKRK